MHNLKDNKYLYDNIPVIYCKSCLSLHIANYSTKVEKYPEEGVIDTYDYCKSCGSTNLGVCTILEYQELYKKRYGCYPLESF